MNLQIVLAISAAALAALYFLQGVVRDLTARDETGSGGCAKCSAGGCPAARKE